MKYLTASASLAALHSSAVLTSGPFLLGLFAVAITLMLLAALKSRQD